MKKKVSMAIPNKARNSENADKWVESATPITVSKPKAETKRFTIDMPVTLHKEFKAYCVENDLKMNNVTNDLIVKFLNKQ